MRRFVIVFSLCAATGWIAAAQVIALDNYPVSNNQRIGIRVEGLSDTQIQLTLTRAASGKVVFNLPAFINNIAAASTGMIDEVNGEVTLGEGETAVVVTLKQKP